MRQAATRRALSFAALVTVAACVEIGTGPSGAASIRLDRVPPSVIVGDVLRDSAGQPARLRAIAFDEQGKEIADAEFRFTALSLSRDTTAASRQIWLTVDSVTGAVRALTPDTVPKQARLAARLGERLQVLDTIDIVPRPTTLARGSVNGDSVRTIAFFCSEPLTATPTVATAFLPNANHRDTIVAGDVTPLATTLTATIGGKTVPIPRYLVRYEILSPATIPSVTLPNGSTRRAIDIVDGQTDSRVGFDTTDLAGTASPRLRIFAAALGATAFADTLIPVRVRAFARTTPTDTVRSPVTFAITLRRLNRSPVTNDPIVCAGP